MLTIDRNYNLQFLTCNGIGGIGFIIPLHNVRTQAVGDHLTARRCQRPVRVLWWSATRAGNPRSVGRP